FYPSHISRILSNPVYLGKVNTASGLAEGMHKSIIDRGIFKSVNRQIELRKMKNRTRPAKYLLTGFLKCSKCGGNLVANYGYYNYKDVKLHGYRCKNIVNGSCFMAIIELEAKLVRKIFDMSNSGMGVSTILKNLYKSGTKTRRGYNFYPSHISRILSNPVYLGKVNTASGLAEGMHKSIIDRGIFKSVNRQIELRKMKNRTRPAKYLLTGFLKCSKCGGNLVANYGYYNYKDVKLHGNLLGYHRNIGLSVYADQILSLSFYR
ncbi:unnamed protein product, partial [marine sediment metagenome]